MRHLQRRHGRGHVLEDKRQAAAKRVYATESPQPVNQVVTVNQPIQGLGTFPPIGGMVLLREEGWKEVKMSGISEGEPKPSVPAQSDASSEIQILLKRHSYQAGLWDPDEMGQHQYLEGARRQVERCERFPSVNDGAPWIGIVFLALTIAVNLPSTLKVASLKWIMPVSDKKAIRLEAEQGRAASIPLSISV